jgi:hypothetical protein
MSNLNQCATNDVDDEHVPSAEPVPLSDIIFDVIVSLDSFDKDTIAKQVEAECGTRDFALALWTATERVRRDTGAVFIKSITGLYERANPKQKVGRGRRFVAAAGRKVARAKEILDSVAATDLPPEERHGFELSRDKVGALVSSQRQIRNLRSVDPVGCSIPNMPKSNKA